ncbi:MAG: hypothetical protein U1E45_12390 [Geminicoccaceae bacterium]
MATDIGGRMCGSIKFRRWGMTLGATAVSTYALDAIAAGAGILLVASEILADLDQRSVLVFLGGSYLLWIAGLRVNLAANWELLESTGTSTNAPSKAAYDIVASRTGNVRARRTASAVGYVATEIAKETPYYAGALGAALAS